MVSARRGSISLPLSSGVKSGYGLAGCLGRISQLAHPCVRRQSSPRRRTIVRPGGPTGQDLSRTSAVYSCPAQLKGQLMSLPSSVWCSWGWRIRPRPHSLCDRCLAAAATREASDPVRRGGSARALGIPSIVLFGLLVVAHTVHAQGTPGIGGGDDFTCALGPSGRVFCWGSNSAGQIGIGAGMASPVTFEARPVEIAGGFKTVASGLFHSCGLQLDGSAYCWGSNANGQLGTNPSAAQAVSLPVRVETSARFQAISAGGSILSSPPANGMLGDVPGSHTCALEVGTGRAFCWGLNFNGQLGQNPQLVRFTAVPSPVSLPSPGGTPLEFKAISAGGIHTCGIDLTGDAWCWGSNVEAKSGDVDRCGYTTNLQYPVFL